MRTSFLPNNDYKEFKNKIISQKFTPKLKFDNDIFYTYNYNENHSIINNTNISENNKNNKINQMSFLFPPIPEKVNIIILIYLFFIYFNLQKIESLLYQNNFSIDEGIEKLKELTLSDKKNNNLKKENSAEKNSIAHNINLSRNSSNMKFQIKFPHIYKRKRNYITSIISSSHLLEKPQNNKIESGAKIRFENLLNNNKFENKNLLIKQKSEQEGKILENQLYKNEKEKKENPKNELKTVDIVAQALISAKNENELKEYLFFQLQFLDNKKRNEKKIEIIKNTINQLDKDKKDLRKCNIGVSRALNKKLVENYKLDMEIKKIENDIEKLRNNIKYYENLGDNYIQELNKIKSS